ncbi:hypothetical protein QN277_016921 [Acacia crassicarpa]|uniref:Uncharacterized protein n=1 Tax=Acacia crassicarpa TaxID=499986 RepID=A0AAE1MXN9_9FABA|nr:hypothetical protein QN277_016921 [Acacia crassicarpa]
MQVAKIPILVCQEVERVQRRFIWGHSETASGFRPVGWEQIILPKRQGSLGLKRPSSLNDACGAKLASRLISGSKGLWMEVLLNKYMLIDDEDLLCVKNSDSSLWKFIVQQKELVNGASMRNIRNGRSDNFFNDEWLLQDQPLITLCSRPLCRGEQ